MAGPARGGDPVTTAPEQVIDLIAVYRFITEDAPLPHLEHRELEYAAHLLVQDGHSSRQISERLGVHKRTVDRWRARRAAASTPEPTPADSRWQEYARCRGTDAALFFPDEDGTHSYSRARGVCGGCPVRSTCLADAMAREGDAGHEGRAGMWGGLSPDQRAALALIRREAAAA